LYIYTISCSTVSMYNFPDAGGNILFVSENKADCDAEIGKSQPSL